MTVINMHSNVFDNVYQFQFYQDNLDYCILNIVKRETYTEKDEKTIYNELERKIGGELELKIYMQTTYRGLEAESIGF